MLSLFLKVDMLGTLYTDEVFFFYEEPQIFTCISKTGQKYLSLLTDMDTREWILAPISEAQLSLLKSNRISVRDAFVNPEDDIIWKIKYKESLTSTAEWILPTNILDNDLPENDVYLDYDSDDLLPIVSSDILKMAKAENRDILDISLITNNHCREVNCEILGETLSNTQHILYTLPMKSDDIRARTSKDSREKNTMVAAGLFAASFGIRLKSPGLGDLFGETCVSPTLKMFADLLDVKDDNEKLKRILHSHSKKTIFKYRRLMKVLLQSEAGFKVRLASPNNYSFNIDFSTDDILRSLNLLDGEIKDMVSIEKMYGNMVGIHVEKQTFAFKSLDDENIIGKFSADFEGVTFEVPKFVEAEIERRVTFNEVTNEEKYHYKLLSINVNVINLKEGEES